MARVSKTYRFEQKTLDMLGRLCEEKDMTATAVIEAALEAYSRSGGNGNTSEREIARLEKELERLHAALERAQDATKAAQALQGAAEKRAADAEQRALALPDPDAWKKKGLLDRLLKR